MNDLINRLRSSAKWDTMTNELAAEDHICFIAADKLEEQAREIEELKRDWEKESGDLDKCPVCGGVADNGNDRCYPPNPYVCTRCEQLTAAQKEIAAKDSTIKYLNELSKQYVDERTEARQGEAAAQKEIEELTADRDLFAGQRNTSNREIERLGNELAAAQAQIVKYREALERIMRSPRALDPRYSCWTDTEKLLAQPTDQPALDEAIRKAKIEVLTRLHDPDHLFLPLRLVNDIIKELEK